MRRRDLLAGLLATTAASTILAAEPNKLYRLAACQQFGMDRFSYPPWPALFARLRQLGYIEGKNLIVDRFAVESRPERYAEIARNMVRPKPDVIAIGINHQLISQVARETATIPIIALMGDPVAAGLLQNMARPEGNITGIAFDAGIDMQGKHLDILRQAVPSVSRIAYLSVRPDWEGAWGRAVVEAGRRSGISIIGILVEPSADEPQYHQAFERMAEQSAEALTYNGLGQNVLYLYLIAELAVRYRLPCIGWSLDVVESGQGLLSYGVAGAEFDYLIDRWADQVAQVFNGAKIADIPIHQPTKFTLAINLKTAKALGLEIPAGLIARADEVIE
jgi:ABC-type uncharacterized transport system substrate-binding protein